MLLFSKNDRKIKLEVGYGLEPIITDAISSRIIRDIMIPEFKQERYYGGINLVISKIIEIINDPTYADEFANVEEENSVPIVVKVILGLFITAFLSVFVFFGFKLLINLFRGLIIGKISIFSFPFINIVFGVLISLPFIIMPLVFFILFASMLVFDFEIGSFVDSSFIKKYLNQINLIIFSVFFCNHTFN